MRKILFSFLMFAAAPAFAQGTAQERSDCMGDALRFCSADIPFVSAIEDCLEGDMSRLSAACRREFEPTRTTRLREEHFYR
ncbi:hypothetical protein ACNHKD_12610 [Methylocystis sp. JAN1]|uniref:hypothetical protein n=1 Tax=Methylocystis sp. JAN1 TaxID=3397211 RepID=UPI003FA1CA56